MKKMGYIIMLIGCVMLLGFVGNDELHPGGDIKGLLVKLLVAASVVAVGLFLAGVRHEDHTV